MSDPVNLNRFRKARAKVESVKQAEENRTRFGRTRAQRDLDKALVSQNDKHLDAHRLNDDE